MQLQAPAEESQLLSPAAHERCDMPDIETPSDGFDGHSRDGMATRPSHRRPEPDAHGQAALLLSESILHTLVEAGFVTHLQAVAAVRTACDVKHDVAEEAGESSGVMQQSLDLLAGIERSLAADGNSPSHRDGEGPTRGEVSLR